MNNFKDFGIQAKASALIGDKIKIDSVINREIVVREYKVQPSKINGRCLYLQIEHKDEKRVIFVGSEVLIDLIEQVPKEKFPFKTTIVRNDGRYEFT